MPKVVATQRALSSDNYRVLNDDGTRLAFSVVDTVVDGKKKRVGQWRDLFVVNEPAPKPVFAPADNTWADYQIFVCVMVDGTRAVWDGSAWQDYDAYETPLA